MTATAPLATKENGATSSTSRVFIILVGGYGNIGDALIRRRALEWVRGLGPVEAYVGNAPSHWLTQMGLTDSDRVYSAREAGTWVWRLLTSRRPKVLVLDPGEALLTARQTPKELGFLGMTVLAKLFGARVVRTPRAVREPTALTAAIHRLACKASDIVLWREQKSIDLMRVGRLVPDIGFSEPTAAGQPWAERKRLTVSLRGLRDWPSDAWFDAIAAYAAESGLTLTTVSQVREDEKRTLALAERWGAEAIPWGDRDDLEQEGVARGIYEESAYVISDRMHVLVFAALSGAVPLELVDHPKRKIRDHFGLIGIDGISLDTEGLDSDVITAFLRSAAPLQPVVTARIADAQKELSEVEATVRTAISRWR